MPTAGVRNIITEGFGVRGQVDLIDFQSTPDGPFKYLLNYIDHGVKKLTCVPLPMLCAESLLSKAHLVFCKPI